MILDKLGLTTEFQSTFPRGERLPVGLRYHLFSYFNPRSLVGNDGSLWPSGLPCAYFNPRSLVGNDFMGMSIRNLAVISIHVPSWGTTGAKADITKSGLFQSTFPRGERPCGLLLSCLPRISIHVPSWGTTLITFPVKAHIPISIHVPSWGTTTAQKTHTLDHRFQSTFPRGERRPRQSVHHRQRSFQSTFPRGERRSIEA